jgi:hypothetical protein
MLNQFGLAALAVAIPLCFASCNKPGNSSRSSAFPSQGEAAPKFPPATHQFDVHKSFKAGESFSLPLDPNRTVDQVTIKYHGAYTVLEKGPDGTTLLNDEGQPRYKDGMYAFGYAVQSDGNKLSIAPKKFVDAQETDNWHDLTNAKGEQLLVEFAHAPKYAADPEVLAVARTVAVTTVLVRYEDAPGQLRQDYVYNANDDDSMSTAATSVPDGSSHTVMSPAG